MKRTQSIITITLTALLLLLASCNSDASAGLFRQLADSKEPVGIRYKQILGRTGAPADTLYFLTDDGIYSKKDNESAKAVKENEKNKPILAAHLDTDNSKFIYAINAEKNGIELYSIDLDGSNKQPLTPVSPGLSNQRLKKLLPNGSIIAEGKIGANEAFSIFPYDNPAAEILFDNMNGWSLRDVLLVPGISQTSTDFIITFVKGNTFIHYYNKQTDVIEIDKPLASFTKNSFGKLFILTEDGIFYSNVVVNVPNPTSLDTKKTYQKDAFLYPVDDTHFITKSNAQNEAFTVITGDKAASVKDGYAKHMNNVNIVSALEIEADDGNYQAKLLIATHENGMFGLTIPFVNANSNSNTGSSTAAEEYKVDW